MASCLFVFAVFGGCGIIEDDLAAGKNPSESLEISIVASGTWFFTQACTTRFLFPSLLAADGSSSELIMN
jgi:hypothetical protein